MSTTTIDRAKVGDVLTTRTQARLLREGDQLTFERRPEVLDTVTGFRDSGVPLFGSRTFAEQIRYYGKATVVHAAETPDEDLAEKVAKAFVAASREGVLGDDTVRGITWSKMSPYARRRAIAGAKAAIELIKAN